MSYPWCDTWLDLLVLDQAGRPARLRSTVILDDHSRAVPWVHRVPRGPVDAADALGLPQSIWRKTEPGWPVCGLPAVLYSDHGADFTSTHIVQVCADLMRRPDTEGVYSMLTMDMSPTLSAADGFRVTTAAVLGK